MPDVLTDEELGDGGVNNTKQSDYVNLDEWDFGDVVAVVEHPASYPVPGPGWKLEDVHVATATSAAYAAARAAASAGTVFAGTVPIVAISVIATRLLLARPKEQRERPPHVALIAVKDARALVTRDQLFFPDGGPTVGSVYARHPLRRRDYLPFATFHRLILNEKAIEIARYLLSLGARDVCITWRQDDGKDVKAEAGVDTPTPLEVSMGMGMGREKSGQLTIRVSGAGKAGPRPQDLIWPDQDRLFTLAGDAAHAGAETFHFGMTTEQIGSVNAKAAMGFKKELKLNLGGEYKSWENLTFIVEAAFNADSVRAST